MIRRVLAAILASAPLLLAQEESVKKPNKDTVGFSPLPAPVLILWFCVSVALAIWPLVKLMIKKDGRGLPLDIALIEDGALIIGGPALLFGTFAEALVKGIPNTDNGQAEFIMVAALCILVLLFALAAFDNLLDIRLRDPGLEQFGSEVGEVEARRAQKERNRKQLLESARVGIGLFGFCVIMSSCITAALYAMHY
jgi:hypothetical protein